MQYKCESTMSLSESQRERYSRQLVLPGFGDEGQQRLLAGKVLLIGAGGLGSAAGLYLAASGVGTIGVVDGDRVDLSNLQRQILHRTADLGRAKAASGTERMRAVNPDVKVLPHPVRFEAVNALALLQDYDFVIDATDNFPTKFLIADACHLAGKPYAHAGIRAYTGQTMTVLPGRSACYRCVFGGPPAPGTEPTGAQTGVLGAVPGVIGSIQATEAIKFLLGSGALLTDRLLVYDALNMTFRRVAVQRNPDCPLCGESPRIRSLA